MEKQIIIKGMSCKHCSSRVENALKSIPGVDAKVDLENGTANIFSDKEISKEVITEKIEDLGFDVTF